MFKDLWQDVKDLKILILFLIFLFFLIGILSYFDATASQKLLRKHGYEFTKIESFFISAEKVVSESQHRIIIEE